MTDELVKQVLAKKTVTTRKACYKLANGYIVEYRNSLMYPIIKRIPKNLKA